MSNDTTTDKGTEESQAPQGQAENSIEQSAESLRSDVSASEETSSTTPNQEPEASEDAEDNSQESQSTAEVDDGLSQWASNKGVDLSDATEKEVKAYQMAYNSEKRMHDATTAAKTSALADAAAESNDYDDQAAVIAESRILNFYTRVPDAQNYDAKMGEIYSRFEKTDPEFAANLLKRPETLYAMAKNEDNQTQAMNARQQGKNEAYDKVKRAKAASSPSVNASDTRPADTTLTLQKIAKIIAEGKYNEYRDEIIAFERSQYGLK